MRINLFWVALFTACIAAPQTGSADRMTPPSKAASPAIRPAPAPSPSPRLKTLVAPIRRNAVRPHFSSYAAGLDQQTGGG